MTSPNPADERHFDVTNQAYQRFLTLVDEHFEATHIVRQSDEHPLMISLIDMGSGDAFTVYFLDTVANTAPHVLISLDTDGRLALHGVFTGPADATRAHRQKDPSHLTHRVLPLIDPGSRELLPSHAWAPLGRDLAPLIHPDPTGTPALAVVLLDRSHGLAGTFGPFTDHDHAAAWTPAAGLPPNIEKLIVGIQPTAAAQSAAPDDEDL